MIRMLIINCLVSCFILQVRAQSSTIQIDAMIGDWPSFFCAENLSGTSYRFFSDSSFLYIALVTTNKSAIHDVLLNGMDVQLLEKRRVVRKKITYPLGVYRIVRNSEANAPDRNMKDMILNMKFNMGVKGILERKFIVIDSRKVNIGIEAKFNLVEKDVLIVEAKVPLRFIVKDTLKWDEINLKLSIFENRQKSVLIKRPGKSWTYDVNDGTVVQKKKMIIKAVVSNNYR